MAKALATELKAGSYDLILFGKMAVDDYNHQVGVMTAELMGLPCITAVAHLKVSGGAVEGGAGNRRGNRGFRLARFRPCSPATRG